MIRQSLLHVPGYPLLDISRRPLTTGLLSPRSMGLDENKVGFSDFTYSGYWDVYDVLRSIFKEASEAMGKEFPYPEKK